MINEQELNIALAQEGKTKADMAEYLGINRSTLSKKINGKTKFTLPELQKMAALFGKERMYAIFF